MLRKTLLWFLISISAGSMFLIFVRMTTESNNEMHENISQSLLRIYENFLLRTKSNYDEFLRSGTDYSKEDQVFLGLTEKLQKFKANTPEYLDVKKQFAEEIQKNQTAFQHFYQKVSNANAEEMSDTLKKLRSDSAKHKKDLEEIN